MALNYEFLLYTNCTKNLNTLTDNELWLLHNGLQDAGIELSIEAPDVDIEELNDWETAMDKITQEIVNRFTMKHYHSLSN